MTDLDLAARDAEDERLRREIEREQALRGGLVGAFVALVLLLAVGQALWAAVGWLWRMVP